MSYSFEIFDMLDYWWLNLIALFSVLILILAWLFWSLHMRTLTTVYHSAWHVDFLTCILILIVFEHDFCITIHFDCCILAYLVCTWWYIWALPDCVSHDCPPFAWLCAACLCGSHIYPLISHPLVSVIPFISVLTIASVRHFVCLLSDRARD